MRVIVAEMTAVYLAVHLEIVHNKMCLITSHKTVANIYSHKVPRDASAEYLSPNCLIVYPFK